MNRISKCLRFQLKNMLKSTFWFVVIYSLVVFALISPVLLFSDGAAGSFNTSLYTGAAFFAFIYVISDYRASFNYLMINGNTRRTIFLSTTAANIIMSIVLAVLSFLYNFIDEFVLTKLSNSAHENTSLFQLFYPNAVKAMELPYMAALFILITGFSLLYGALAYKFGKYFITIFWVGVGLMFAAIPLSSSASGISLLTLIGKFLWLNHPHGMLLASVNFLIAALVFNAAVYLISSRQSQTAPVT